MSLATDPRFETNTLRVENRKILDDELRPVIEGYQSEDLLRTLQGNGVAVCVVNSARDIYEDPHLWERGSLIKVWDENLSREVRSEEHTSELQSLMRISYAVFCLKKQNTIT